MAKVDYSTAASLLALSDARKPDPHPPRRHESGIIGKTSSPSNSPFTWMSQKIMGE
ncbi:hypothetical protein Hanom_Chr10g00937161 [Helianthus anomalus]